MTSRADLAQELRSVDAEDPPVPADRVAPADPPLPSAPVVVDGERPRSIRPTIPLVDRVYRGAARACALAMLLIMGGIGVFLAYQAVPTLRHLGWRFFTESQWVPEANRLGIAAALLGTVKIALVAIGVASPLALGTALFISEYAPQRLRRWLVALLDLMAAVPSVVFGLWGFYFLQPQLIFLSRWFADRLGFLPVFRVDDPSPSGTWDQTRFTSSGFIAGLVVALMVLPVAASMMREVFMQAPIAEREGALALGATRWGVICSVVLQFGRGGIIGGTMLGLGRALGETIAVVIIISPAYRLDLTILQNGAISISSNIALRFGDAYGFQISALLASGLVLFLFTLLINTLASIVVARSRSGAGTDI